jgi:hypothetical protein
MSSKNNYTYTKAENEIDLNFRVSDYASELFEIKFKKILKHNKHFISTEEENFKNEIKNQFFEFLLEENPWKSDNIKENTDNTVRYYFNIIRSIK